METRRSFLSKSGLALLSSALLSKNTELAAKSTANIKQKKPIVISTWHHGLAANEAAWKVLSSNGRALDAVEKGVMVSEADPKVTSVGYGGMPDRDGNVTLDACIMDEFANCGSVCFLEHIMHPISVARKVMELTPHIMLAGDGALKFALDNGFKKENLLTPEAETEWKKWLNESNYHPAGKDNHDTIGMLALDNSGNLSGACTTSGLAWKYRGRVGDSPIIGAGMYVDNEIGAGCATGKGEAVIRVAGSFLLVELMRNGKSPQKACEEVIKRIAKKEKKTDDLQVGVLALSRKGEIGAFSFRKGFQFAVYTENENKLIDSAYLTA